MKRKLAMYALYGKGEHIKEVSDYIDEDKDWTKLTEEVDVDFVEREQADVVKEKISYLEEKKQRLRAEHNLEMDRVDEAIKQLLVIEYKPE